MILASLLSILVYAYFLKRQRLVVVLGIVCALLAPAIYYLEVIIIGGILDGFTSLGMYVTFLICIHVNAVIQVGYGLHLRQFGWPNLLIWIILLVPSDVYTWWTLFGQDA